MVLSGLIGESPGIAAVRDQVARLAGLRAEAGRLPPVLLQGETGTGKGLVAREGLKIMTEVLAGCRATGACLPLPYLLSHIADAHLSAGDVPRGLAAVAEGLSAAAQSDMPNYVPELLRLRGEMLASSPDTRRDAEASFAQAVSLASGQRSWVFAGRAAASFARHLRSEGRSAEAERMLAELERL